MREKAGLQQKDKGCDDLLSINDYDFQKLAGIIKNKYGLNLFSRKAMVEARLTNYLEEKGYYDFHEYLETLYSHSEKNEMANLINKLTTNYTYFMREAEHFKHFTEVFLPWAEKNVKDHDLRIWSAGCSYGNEAYNLAMCLNEYFGRRKKDWDLKILATDISFNALRKASDGIYSQEEVCHLSDSDKDKYFMDLGNNYYKVKEIIRENVIFKYHNLMDRIPFKKPFDLIVCRNVMIYFDDETRTELCNKFYDATVDGGFLYIGHAESVNNLKYQKTAPAVYRKIGGE